MLQYNIDHDDDDGCKDGILHADYKDDRTRNDNNNNNQNNKSYNSQKG